MRDVERRLRAIEAAMDARGRSVLTAGQAAAGADWFNRRLDRLIVQAEEAGPNEKSAGLSEAERLAHALAWGPDKTARLMIEQWKQRATEGLRRLRSQ